MIYGWLSSTTIGGSAFLNCSSLASVVVPRTVTGIGYSAFPSCVGTGPQFGLALPGAPTRGTIRCVPCSGRTHLNAVDLGGVTSIGMAAFNGCVDLVSVSVPPGVVSIGAGAFEGCSRLVAVGLPDTVAAIGSSAFSYCTALTTVTIPARVTAISHYTFYGCSSLAAVAIPAAAVSIGDYAFYGCTSLATVAIPSPSTRIGDSAFGKCGCSEALFKAGAGLCRCRPCARLGLRQVLTGRRRELLEP